MKRKAPFILAGVVALVLLSGAVLYTMPAGDKLFRTPENVLEKSARLSSFRDESNKEHSTSGSPSTLLTSDTAISATGDIKSAMSMECTAEAPELGNVTVKTDLRIINDKMYTNIKSIDASKLKGADKQAYQTFLKPMLNKWVESSEPSYEFLSIKENGFYPSLGGVYTKGEFTGEEVARAFMDNKALTIESAKKAGSGDDRHYIMKVKISRSGYDNALKQLKSDYKYRDKILETFFEDDDSMNVEVALRIKDGKTLWVVYETKNPCREIAEIAGVDAREFPQFVSVKNEASDQTSKAKDLSVPKGALSEQQFSTIIEQMMSQLGQ